MSTNGFGTTGHSYVKKKSNHRPYILHKNNPKWIIDLNVKFKIIKFLDDNIGENPDDFGSDDDFLDTKPKAWSMN